jgi:glycosyltransferase involved in cell wall biosynthesis
MRAILEQTRRVPSVLDAIALSEALAAAAVAAAARGGLAAEAVGRELVEATRDATDAPTAITAAHALARLPGIACEAPLRDLLDAGGWLAPHAAWALADRPALRSLLDPLARLVEGGRLGGMLAQRTLWRWAAAIPAEVADAVGRRLAGTTQPLARARLVETLGLVGGDDATLLGLACDPAGEPIEVRRAAIAALGDRPGSGTAELRALAAADGAAGATARLALLDHGIAPAKAGAANEVAGHGRARGRAGDRLRIAQVHLGGQLDRSLAHAGQGSTGGIATLLVQLGDALASDPRVAAVTTIGRGSASEALTALEAPDTRAAPSGGRHVVLPAPLGRHEDVSFLGDWPAVIAAERGLRRVLARRPARLLHLRMADVGSLAASRIARRHGLPTVFTLAPDPHGLIADMERAGELDRASFGPADAAGALWFRARLVRYLADSAAQVVLFPRSELATRLRDLLAIDIAADPRRYHVVPEGIDPVPIRAARLQVARLATTPVRASLAAPSPTGTGTAVGSRSAVSVVPRVLVDLREAVEALGPGRVGLPLVVSVGRRAEVKGMARLVEAFANDDGLRQRANLVIVGGDLDDPTAEERAEIDRIDSVLAQHPEMAEALVMLGHRPHDDVLRLLAAAEVGLAGTVAAGGAYACGSRKEEFGLAIVEALAAGLPVVAPRAGGPASYLEDGITGRLVDTLDQSALVAGIHDALDLASLPGRADRARSLVAKRFTLGSMSSALIRVYAGAGGSMAGSELARRAVLVPS